MGVRGAQQARRRLGERALGGTAQAGRAQGVQATGGRWAQAHAEGERQQAQASGELGARGQCAPGCAQLGQVGVLCTLTQFFGPIGLSTVPESLNEHCSLQNNF